MTPAEVACVFEGHGEHLGLEKPEPEDYPRRAVRVVCMRCDFECSDPDVIKQYLRERAEELEL